MKHQSDYGTPERPELREAGPVERHQHGDEVLVEATEKAGQTRVVILTQDALDRYYRRQELYPGGRVDLKEKKLEDNQENKRLYDAGCIFRREWHDAGLDQNIISRYSDMVSNGSVVSFQDGRIDDLAAWQRSVLAIGPVACNEVIVVCCLGEPIGREKMIVLRRGLRVLWLHYGN